MEFRTIQRPSGSFQQGVRAEDVQAVARAAFGRRTVVEAAVELGGGMYNSVYRIRLRDRGEPVVLRVAPPAERQFASEAHLLRNEYASVPWLAPIAALMPQVLAADFTGKVIGRDWMIQSLVPGTPAPERLSSFPKDTHSLFFRQLGEITAAVHAVVGPYFGQVAWPGLARWSGAVVASLRKIADDVEGCGLNADDLCRTADVAQAGADLLDEIGVPRLLTGDLWTVNTLLAPAPVPAICGVLDLDRTWWGDPEADWTMRMARAKQDERMAFFDTYPRPLETDAAVWRRHVYEVRHLGALRLERHRLGNQAGVRDSYAAVAVQLSELAP
ncbi:phosphotransferase family protein [Streptomyces antarcticus]|uniref:phosphotransferase family protein n=1 Tax=Streptomyces antarcticus TaxID=2996458 RepID=UPI00226F9F9D|nr:aminoglycoside phosphotransferase family protein [Streptomyces sp. H34-AA3]MCY0945665.1 aminoglycoside phosphotransferase family protein [Streptomyces sp. H34-AA3]